MTGSKHFKAGIDTDPVMADVLKLSKPGERREGPSTFVGRVGLQPGLGFAAENERLKAERSSGMVILRLDPKAIRRTEFANRLEASLSHSDESLRHLKESIRRNLQDTPIVVRPAPSDSGFEYEIVEGHRRHAAILELDTETEGGFPIFARLDASASETLRLVLKMYRENADREDLSPYETGTMFEHWLQAGLFRTQRVLGEAVGQPEHYVSRYLSVSALPPCVLKAFRDPRVIALRWAPSLTKVSRDLPEKVSQLADILAAQDPAPSPDVVYAALTELRSTLSKGQITDTGRASESIKEGNKVLFELSAREGRFGIRLGKHIDKKLRKPLQRELKDWLHAWLKSHAGDGK